MCAKERLICLQEEIVSHRYEDARWSQPSCSSSYSVAWRSRCAPGHKRQKQGKEPDGRSRGGNREKVRRKKDGEEGERR